MAVGCRSDPSFCYRGLNRDHRDLSLPGRSGNLAEPERNQG